MKKSILKKKIRHNKPSISNNSIKAAKLSLSLGKLTTGDKVKNLNY